MLRKSPSLQVRPGAVPGKQLFLELFAPRDVERRQGQDVSIEARRHTGVGHGKLLTKEATFQKAQPGTTVLLRQCAVEETNPKVLPHRLWVVALVLVPLEGNGRDLAIGRIPGPVSGRIYALP